MSAKPIQKYLHFIGGPRLDVFCAIINIAVGSILDIQRNGKSIFRAFLMLEEAANIVFNM